jgi:hypothetical protein
MADQIEAILKLLGPSLSSDVVAELARRAKIAPAAARKRLSRAGGNVLTLTQN